MGTQFFLFYDILIVGMVAGIVYRGVRKGFASGIIGLIGWVLAFIVALTASMPAAVMIYDNVVSEGIIEKVDYKESDSSSAEKAFKTLRDADMSQAVVKGQSIDELEKGLKFDSAGKAEVDLSEVDLSNTGIDKGDLSFFGINANFARAPRDLGKVDILASKTNKYELGDIILSYAVAEEISKKAVANSDSLKKILVDTIPGASKGDDLLSNLLLNIINSDAKTDTLEEVIDKYLVRPVILVPIRALMFVIIFAAITAIIGLIASALQLVNNIPTFGTFNSVLGGVLGLVNAAISVALVCIAVSIIIVLFDDNIIFLNTATIDKTYIFKHIFALDFLRF